MTKKEIYDTVTEMLESALRAKAAKKIRDSLDIETKIYILDGKRLRILKR